MSEQPSETTSTADTDVDAAAVNAGAAGDASEAVLALDGVCKRFGGLVAVDGATFSVAPGEITGLIGPNGAGKSTLFDCITGVHTPDEGEIRLTGDSIQGLSTHEISAQGLGRTFQTPRVFRGMTVRENLAFASPSQTGERALQVLARRGRVQTEERTVQQTVDEALQFLELEHLADEYADGLSGGQRKLLELGRVLMMDPEIILLDEPVAGVNPALVEELLEKLHELNATGRTIFFIEHDMDIIMNHCDKVIVLHNGRTLATGSPDIVRDDDRVIDAYLGGYE